MKTKTEKQSQRMENKRKKLAAFLEIVKLNDIDRVVSEEKQLKSHDVESESSVNVHAAMTKNPSSSGESKNKRIKTFHDNHCPEDIKINPEPALVGPSGKEVLQGDDYLRLRKELKERKKRLMKQPLFRLKAEGEKACINIKDADRTPLFFSDIQRFLLYSLVGDGAPYSPFAWCQFEKHNTISHTVVLVLEGLSLYDYLAYESCFPSIAAIFNTKLEIITPSAYNGNFSEELALLPMTHIKEYAMIKRYGSLDAVLRADSNVFRILRSIFPILESDETPSAEKGTSEPELELHPSDRFPRTHLVMSPSQLIDECFPVPLKGPLKARYVDYTLTKDIYKEVTPHSPMYALDCEMCMTTSGVLELTRISIVNELHEIVYNELVLPHNRITDYLTRYSGITAQMLVGVTKRLEHVQDDIRRLLPTDAILVGQSLNIDLHTLKMMHPYVIDTSVIYNVTSDYRRKTKLSTLSLRFLGEEIQKGRGGHCPTEDSAACMKLVQLKLANSLAFGDTILASYLPEYRSLTMPQPYQADAGLMFIKFEAPGVEALVESRTVCQTYTTPKPGAENEGHLATTLFSYLKRDKKTVGIVGTAALLQEYTRWIKASRVKSSVASKRSAALPATTIDTIPAPTESDVYRSVVSACGQRSFTIGHVRYEEQALTEGLDKETHFRQVDAGCKMVWSELKTNGLCVVVFGGRRGGANGACFIQLKKEDIR